MAGTSDDVLTTADIAKKLGVTHRQVELWRSRGMPARKVRGIFLHDGDAIAKWLIASGEVTTVEEEEETDDDTGPIYRNRRECARVFGTSVHTVAIWLTDPSFPGRSGTPGARRADGYFPGKPIARWLKARNAKASIPPELLDDEEEASPATGGNPKDRLFLARATKAELELDKLQGTLVSAAEMERRFVRVNAYAQTKLRELPHRLVAAVPSDWTDEAKRIAFRVAETIVDEVSDEMRVLLRKDDSDDAEIS
jgi:phage terminase Nu1 subunit (DNA packaging protein)